MEMSSECVYCVVSQMDGFFMRFVGDESRRMPFLRKVCTAIGASGNDTLAPLLNGKLLKLVAREAGMDDLFEEEKHVYNQAILQMEGSIKAHIDAAEDKLYRALQYAMAGNYIDFGTSAGVSMEKLNDIIEAAPGIDHRPERVSIRLIETGAVGAHGEWIVHGRPANPEIFGRTDTATKRETVVVADHRVRRLAVTELRWPHGIQGVQGIVIPTVAAANDSLAVESERGARSRQQKMSAPRETVRTDAQVLGSAKNLKR